jgi:hypothetical protein
MTDEQLSAYYAKIEPVRCAFLTEQYRLEDHAAAGVARDLDGLAGVHGDVIAFIEGRWTTWLDVRILRLNEQYERDAARIREETGIT